MSAKTPGRFKIFDKQEKYTSKKYHVPMDYALFFTSDGKAIHKSQFVRSTSYLKMLGVDALGSHGCVRLSEEDARAIFRWAQVGTPVHVIRD